MNTLPIHRYCPTCKTRTFCGAFYCSPRGVRIYNEAIEGKDYFVPSLVDFDLYRLPRFKEEVAFALARAYAHKDDAAITIQLKIVDGEIKTTITTDLTDKMKRSLEPVDVIRENGMFRLEEPAVQGDLGLGK